MDICLVCEGSYPYIVGGVSSWTHNIISSMPEHNFKIVTLYPAIKDKGNFSYTLPDNVIDVKECFLDDMGYKEGKFRRKFITTPRGLREIAKIISGNQTNWEILIDFFSKNRKRSTQDFLMSKPFYDTIVDTYDMGYSHVALSEFFWSIRSMILPLIGILSIEMPKADIYHTVSTGYAGIIAMVGKKQHNGHMIITEHGIYTREREEEIIGASWVPLHFKDMWIKYFHNMSKGAYSYTDKAITLFEDAKIIQNDIGCDSEKQLIIENGVDGESFLKIERKKLGKNGYNVGAIVRVVPIKDILTMLQAFRMIKNEIKDAKLYIIGPNDEAKEYYEECLAVTKLLGLSECVIYTGMVQIKDYMPMIDIMILSSISEGQPLSVLESLAAGIPCVSTNVGSCKEIIYGKKDDEIGHAGIIVPIMDYDSLAKGVIRILENKELHEKMSKNGRKRLEVMYSKNQVVSRYKELYESFK